MYALALYKKNKQPVEGGEEELTIVTHDRPAVLAAKRYLPEINTMSIIHTYSTSRKN